MWLCQGFCSSFLVMRQLISVTHGGHSILNLSGTGHTRCDQTGFSGALLPDKLLTSVDKALDIICATDRQVRLACPSEKTSKRLGGQGNRKTTCFLFLAELLQGIFGHAYNDCNSSRLPMYTDLQAQYKTAPSHSPYSTGRPWSPHLSSPTHSSSNGVSDASRRTGQCPYTKQRLNSSHWAIV